MVLRICPLGSLDYRMYLSLEGKPVNIKLYFVFYINNISFFQILC